VGWWRGVAVTPFIR